MRNLTSQPRSWLSWLQYSCRWDSHDQLRPRRLPWLSAKRECCCRTAAAYGAACPAHIRSVGRICPQCLYTFESIPPPSSQGRLNPFVSTCSLPQEAIPVKQHSEIQRHGKTRACTAECGPPKTGNLCDKQAAGCCKQAHEPPPAVLSPPKFQLHRA